MALTDAKNGAIAALRRIAPFFLFKSIATELLNQQERSEEKQRGTETENY